MDVFLKHVSASTPLHDVTAIVLAGGQGKRLGGLDKGLQLLQGRPLVAYVLERLEKQVETILISANRNISRYQVYGYPVFPDSIAGYPGPLAGFLTGLQHCKTPYLATVPCDTPFIHKQLIRRLRTALETSASDIAVAMTEDHGTSKMQPVFTLMKNHLGNQLKAYLENNGRKLDQWFATLKMIPVHFKEKESFANINTSEELFTCLKNLGGQSINTPTHPSAIPSLSLLSVEQAQKRILASLPDKVLEIEKISLWQANDRILAENLISSIDVPTFNSAAMDGIVFQATSLDLTKDQTLKIVGHAYAGHAFTGIVATGECIQIMTGAVIPNGCDTVIQQENIRQLADGNIIVPANTAVIGENIRTAGESLKKGAKILNIGTQLKPQHLGLLASAGIAEVSVYRKLSVAVFSTGDELCPIGSVLEAGKIYDSNRIILLNLLEQLGCHAIDMGIIEDSPEKLEQALKETAGKVDVILTSGGVSVGEADYTKQVMAKLGGIDFWSVKMRPGRPMAFGKIFTGNRETLLFGLPGNPVAVMVSFLFIVKNALLVLMGTFPHQPQAITAISSTDIPKKAGRTEFQRGVISFQDGQLHVNITGDQGSGIIQSLTDANCIIYLSEEQGHIQKGENVSVFLMDSLL